MRQHKLLWQSSYDRGLNVLLKLWPEILVKYPDAELHIAYGWELFDMITKTNTERQEWKASMVELMKQKGIKHHGRIGKKELQKLRKECGILAYCSDFYEIFCISAMEAQLDGVVPITTDIGALGELTTGRVVVKGDIYDHEVQREYLKQLLLLMGDVKRWHELNKQGMEYAKQYTWDKVATKWLPLFEPNKQDIKVSIVTPTNRRGWWNIMANNLSKQTYKNFEWIIVDDYPDARNGVAKDYADRYGLDIKYLRGKAHKVKRNYGLVNADNTALQQATGEIWVALQDFILIPETGIEDIVNVYRHHPDALQALPDTYYAPKMKPDTTKEDWFRGELDVKGEFMRANARLTNEGFRFTERPFDFEQNYGAIPMKIVKELGGWYEFFDFGLGFNNTEFAYRALKKGYKIIIDETNVATCIDHWKTLEGTPEHGLLREVRLNDPLFLFLMQMEKDGYLPLKRTQEIDDKIDLQYTMPDLGQQDAVEWIRDNMDEVAIGWINKYRNLL